MSWLIATTLSLPLSAWARRSRVGSSLMHGAHQLAHRFTSVGLPANSLRLVGFPSGSLNDVAGSAWPLCVRSTPFPGTSGAAAELWLAVGEDGLWQEASASSAPARMRVRMTRAASLTPDERLVGSDEVDAHHGRLRSGPACRLRPCRRPEAGHGPVASRQADDGAGDADSESAADHSH